MRDGAQIKMRDRLAVLVVEELLEPFAGDLFRQRNGANAVQRLPEATVQAACAFAGAGEIGPAEHAKEIVR